MSGQSRRPTPSPLQTSPAVGVQSGGFGGLGVDTPAFGGLFGGPECTVGSGSGAPPAGFYGLEIAPSDLTNDPALARVLFADLLRLADAIALGGEAQVGRWISVLFASGRSDLILKVASMGDPTFVEGVVSSGLFPFLVLGPKASSDRERWGIWAIWDASSQDGDLARAVFRKLYGNELVGAGVTWTWPKSEGTLDGAPIDVELRATSDEPMGDTLVDFLAMMRGLPPAHVAAAPVMFTHERSWWYRQKVTNWKGQSISAGDWALHPEKNPNPEPMNTSYFMRDNRILMRLVGVRKRGASAPSYEGHHGNGNDQIGSSVGAPDAVNQDKDGRLLTEFENHARHEVGHAVGDRKLPGLGSGNDMAINWAGWEPSTDDELRDAYWDGGIVVSVEFGGKTHRFMGHEVATWLMAIVDTGGAPDGHEITAAAAGNISGMIDAIRADEPSEQLPVYAKWVLLNKPDKGYMVNGFDPGSLVYIRSTRTTKPYMRYQRKAYDALKNQWGWYSLSSPNEMFAEMYTMKYSAGLVPPTIGADVGEWFRQLEALPEETFNAAPKGGTSAMGPGVESGGLDPAPAGGAEDLDLSSDDLGTPIG